MKSRGKQKKNNIYDKRNAFRFFLMSVSSFFCREFKIRLRRDLQIFTDNFRAENSEFDPAKVVEGDVEGRVCWLSYFEH